MSFFARTRSRVVRAGRARTLLAGGTAVVAAAVLIAPAAANAAAPSPAKPAGHIGGIVPVHGQAKASHLRTSSSNMSYHGGLTMTTNNVYTIYWTPTGTAKSFSFDANYQPLIDGFFQNVASASGKSTNVYAVDTQYYDTVGPLTNPITYSSKFGGTYSDTDSWPGSGCTDSVTPGYCLTDAQIQTEIEHVISHNGWTADSSTIFVMLTAPGIGSCSGSSCAFTQYCAYHGVVGSGSSALLYANMPDAGTDLSACGSGQYPNGDKAADSEINVLSHEHNEAITDEQLNAWYDRQGSEIGDKCAWKFGSPLGGSSQNATEYNQVINGHDYYLQQEWSNSSTSCVLTY